MTIEAGKHRRKLDVMRNVSATTDLDSRGRLPETPELVGTVWGDIKPLSGREFLEARKIDSDVTHRITIRHGSELNNLDPAHWLVESDSTTSRYDISQVRQTMERKRKWEIVASARLELIETYYSTATTSTTDTTPPPTPPVPPPPITGYEGFGAAATGGTGGSTVYVTNTNDSGAGSLRQALADLDGTPTIIKFTTSGTIELDSLLSVTADNFTIDGSDALNGGICVRDARTLFTGCNNFIITHMRFRHGDIGFTGISWATADSLAFVGCDNGVVANCSMSWGVDGSLDLTSCTRMTVYECLIYETLEDSNHPSGAHSRATIGIESQVSWHRNIWGHNVVRNPRVSLTHDIVNNVFYNYRSYAPGLILASTGDTKVNIVGNFYRRGAQTASFDNRLEDCKVFFDDNSRHDGSAITKDFRAGSSEVVTRFLYPQLTTIASTNVISSITPTVGASLPKRDSADNRFVSDVLSGTGDVIDSQTEVGGWPDLTV